MRLGTRASALALAQARSVAALLPEAELVPIVTSGDRGLRGGDKSRWVAELERALLSGEIDLAVHSAKDVPGELADGLQLAGAPSRAAVEDVFSEHHSAILIKEDVLAASIGPDGSEHPGRRWSAPGVKPVDAISRPEGVGLAIQFLDGHGCAPGLNYREL